MLKLASVVSNKLFISYFIQDKKRSSLHLSPKPFTFQELILQKCRKKQRRSKRFSGGIVILYKSKLHKGIYELQDMSTSKNRIWLKLDKVFFGLEKDLFICACYIPQ
jgi:hypothetical protein